MVFKGLEIICWDRKLRIYAFVGDVNASEDVQFIPMDEEVVSEDPGVPDVCIFVERDGQPFLSGLLNKGFSLFCT
jgi:hypothetical protein